MKLDTLFGRGEAMKLTNEEKRILKTIAVYNDITEAEAPDAILK